MWEIVTHDVSGKGIPRCVGTVGRVKFCGHSPKSKGNSINQKWHNHFCLLKIAV